MTLVGHRNYEYRLYYVVLTMDEIQYSHLNHGILMKINERLFPELNVLKCSKKSTLHENKTKFSLFNFTASMRTICLFARRLLIEQDMY